MATRRGERGRDGGGADSRTGGTWVGAFEIAIIVCFTVVIAPSLRTNAALGKPKWQRPRRKPRGTEKAPFGVARPWEPGYKPPAPKPVKRVLPSTPFKYRDTDGKVYYKHIPGYTTSQLARMWKKEVKTRPFACKYAPNCTIRFNSRVKRFKHEKNFHRKKNPLLNLEPGTCSRCGKTVADLEQHLDRIGGCTEPLSQYHIVKSTNRDKSEYRRNKEEISRENVLLGRKERRYGKEAAARKHDPRSQHHHQRAVGRKVSIKSFVRDVKRGYGPD
mmetsp:Transcript_42214/g.68039  ORF Transcript_42214/g.68039 Transcript_42214/m.68039 type:complete len:274 (-) Transcript_42214:269-1090(-)